MKFDRSSLLLYAVTDRSWLFGQTLCEKAEACLLGGVTMLQLREKELDHAAFLEEATVLKALCTRYQVPFIINDNVEIAVACGADGVHVGQKDMEAGSARERIGKDKILGVSVQTVEQAKKAQRQGADYLGVGAVFATSTKPDADTVPFGTLRAICDAVSIPVVAIGGIHAKNIPQLKGTGIDGVAVVSAIFAKKDVKEASARLLSLVTEVLS